MGASPTIKKEVDFPINDSSFKSIKDSFCLEDENILEFYEYYRNFDRKNRSYIDFDDFVEYFKSNMGDFVELPYAQKLFLSIPKEKEGIIFFEEFIRGISAFCLLNKESLLRFIFDCIDTDGNQKISKRDLVKFSRYADPQTGENVFFTNFIPDIERFPLKQSQNKIDFDHFRLNSDKLLFIIWPAFSLQEYLRKKIFGINFWYELYSKVEKKEIEYKNNEKKEQRMKEKIETLKRLKGKNMNKENLSIKQTINQRKCKQVGDDCKILARNRRTHRRSLPYNKKQLFLENFERQRGEQ